MKASTEPGNCFATTLLALLVLAWPSSRWSEAQKRQYRAPTAVILEQIKYLMETALNLKSYVIHVVPFIRHFWGVPFTMMKSVCFFVISRTQSNTALVITSANKTLLQYLVDNTQCYHQMQCCRLFSSMISLSKHQKFQNFNKNKSSHSSILIHIHFHNQNSSFCPQGRPACFTYSNSFPFMSYFPAKARSTNAEVGRQLTLRKQWSTLRTLPRRRKRYSRALHSQLSSRY